AVTRQLTREPAVADRLGHPTGAVDTDVTLPGPAGTLVAKFARREGACAYLRITGSCATEPGQILISQRTAGKYGLTPGRRITQLATNLRRNDVELTTALPSVLDQVAGDQAAIGRTAPVIAVPLVLLCWFVLFLLVASLTEERGPEIALAKLRGYPSGRATRFGLGEALLLIALAAPAGLAAGYALVELAARLVLAGGTHAEPRWPLFAAAGVALLGAVAAAVLAGRRTVGREVLGLLRRVPERRRWQAGVAEGVVVALAAASLVAAAGDRTAPLALLAPPLLAVVAGIATARLLGLWARFRLRTARRGGRLAPMLAAAQLSRRPSGQRVVVVV